MPLKTFPLPTIAIVFLLAAPPSYGNEISIADSLYSQGKTGEAKALYEKLADQGNADGLYALAYKFDTDPADRLRHYEAAARAGHPKALGEYIEHGFFYAGLSGPGAKKILDTYKVVKKAHPSFTFFDEKHIVSVLEKAAEVPLLETARFSEKYGIDLKAVAQQPYAVWALAEEASTGSRFGAANPTLTMQLILLDTPAPMELMLAVEEYYPHWQKNAAQPYNLCENITSGMGSAFCNARQAEKAEASRKIQFAHLEQGLTADVNSLLENTVNAHEKFSNLHADNEECFGGTSRTGSVIASTESQKEEFFKMLSAARNHSPGNVSPVSLTESDTALNNAWSTLMTTLKQAPENGAACNIGAESLRNTQRSWLKYRDSASALLHAINPDRSREAYMAELTTTRTTQLKAILEYLQ